MFFEITRLVYAACCFPEVNKKGIAYKRIILIFVRNAYLWNIYSKERYDLQFDYVSSAQNG